MTTTPAILLLVATLGAGVAAGLLHLQRARRPWLVNAHLVLALAATALVAQQVLPAGRSGAWPLLMLVVAVVAGWSARRVARKGWIGGTPLLAGHAVLGVAGFLVFLAWARNLAGG